jgi:hypothetical protein
MSGGVWGKPLRDRHCSALDRDWVRPTCRNQKLTELSSFKYGGEQRRPCCRVASFGSCLLHVLKISALVEVEAGSGELCLTSEQQRLKMILQWLLSGLRRGESTMRCSSGG